MNFEIEKIASGGFVVRDGCVLIGDAHPVIFACTAFEEAVAFLRRKFEVPEGNILDVIQRHRPSPLDRPVGSVL